MGSYLTRKETFTSPVSKNQTGDIFYETLGVKAAYHYYQKRNLDRQGIIRSCELLYSLFVKRDMKWYYFAQGFRFGGYAIAKCLP